MKASFSGWIGLTALVSLVFGAPAQTSAPSADRAAVAPAQGKGAFVGTVETGTAQAAPAASKAFRKSDAAVIGDLEKQDRTITLKAGPKSPACAQWGGGRAA